MRDHILRINSVEFMKNINFSPTTTTTTWHQQVF